MIQLAIKEPKIENFFNNSKDEIMRALEFIVENDINYFKHSSENTQLSHKQKEELNSRIESFHKDPTIGRSWDEIKNSIAK